MTFGVEKYGSNDKFEFAGGYLLQNLELFTDKEKQIKEGNGYNIKDLIQDITIEESITMFALKATFTIIDGVNLIEELKLTGNERILLKIKRRDPFDRSQSISLMFYVTEYPLYGKSTTRTHQAYKIVATTEHGYLNQLLSLSKNIKGNPADIIRKILLNELKISENKLDLTKNTKGLYSYNAPSKKPLSCVRDILRMTTDSEDTPLFLYETLSGMKLRSYKDLIEQSPYMNRLYKLGNLPASSKTVKEKYEDEATSILSLSSNLKLSQLDQITSGSYATTIEYYDFGSKTFVSNKQKVKEISTLSKKSGYSSDFKVDDKEINEFYDASIKTFMTVSDASEGQLNKNLAKQSLKKESILSRQENITHNITLHGDLNLSVGNIIDIEIYTTSMQERGTITKRDNYLSGKYLVTNVTHNFSSNYTIDVKLSKDGF